MGDMTEYTESKAPTDPIKLLKAVEKVGYSSGVGKNEFNDAFNLMKRFLNNKWKGKQKAARWQYSLEADYDAIVTSMGPLWMGGLAHKHFLKKDGVSLDDYYALDPKGDDKKKYDKQVRELFISWQIHRGWDNSELNRHFKQVYGKSKDLAEYPLDICTTIRILDGAEDEQKKGDTHRGKYQTEEQDAGPLDEEEKAGEDEKPSQERVSGAHYVPLSEGQVLAMVNESPSEILDGQHLADNFEDKRVAGVIVATSD